MSAKVRKPKKLILNDDDYDEDLELRASKFLRGEPADLEALKDKKLKGQLAVREDNFRESAHAAAKTEKWLGPTDVGYLVPDELEKTNRITQDRIALEVDILSSRNQYDIVLNDFGPYSLDFTASGRHMTLAGRKGHLAIVDMTELRVIKEFQVRETVRDVVFLHNELFFAAAQKKYPYIYNREGTEIHCLKEHGAVLKLQFLKNHFLLASLNEFGQLHYQDVTTGVMVGNYRTGQGRTDVMQVNPFNGVIGVGHSRGMLSMWKPTSAAPLVQMLCHQGAITALAFHSNGHLMATAGMERKIKIWDLRKYGTVQTITGHAKSMEFSQKGMLAAATGSSVQVLGDLSGSQTYSQYMTHRIAKGYQAQKVAFRPYEDVLAIGHSKGYSSILIPGSGEPNYDSWVANPFETPKQRREREVHGLLDKLPPETIMLDPTKIGSVKPTRKKEKLSKQEREAEKEAAIEEAKNITVKKKTKGRSKSSRVAKKKQEAIKNAKRPFIEQEKNEEEQSKTKRKRVSEDNNDLPKSLQRFAKRKATK